MEHADGTRITTFYKQDKQELRAPDNETGEQAEYSNITKTFVKVECPGFATVIFDGDCGSCETIWGNGTRLHTQANGVSVMHRPDGTQLQIGAKGTRDTDHLELLLFYLRRIMYDFKGAMSRYFHSFF